MSLHFEYVFHKSFDLNARDYFTDKWEKLRIVECNLKHDHENENTKIVSGTIKKYSKNKNHSPVRNVSIDIESKKTAYKLIRLGDEQYYQLNKNTISIFDDYQHQMSLHRDKELIYSSFSKMYTMLNLLFGESGKYYDAWKGSFSFPFLIRFEKDNKGYAYLINVINLRSSIQFNFQKMVFPDDELDRTIMYDPFEDLPRWEMMYIINFLVGYLSGAFEAFFGKCNKLLEPFFDTVSSDLILFGYDGTIFFDNQYDDPDKYEQAVKLLENNRRLNKA